MIFKNIVHICFSASQLYYILMNIKLRFLRILNTFDFQEVV